MAITSVTPVSGSTIAWGDAFSFTIDDTYTYVRVKVQTSTALEKAYDTALGGAQAGYTVQVVDTGGGTHVFTVSRDAGFDRSPVLIYVEENETGSDTTTGISYTLTGESSYISGIAPYNEISSIIDHGTLTGLSDDDHTQYHNDSRGDLRYPRRISGSGAPGVSTGNGYDLGTVYTDTTGDNAYILVDATTDANVWSSGGGSGGGLGSWKYATGGGAPAAGGFTTNSSGLISVNTINISETDNDSVGMLSVLAFLKQGDYILLRNASGTVYGTYRISTLVDNGTYWTLTVQALTVAGSFTDTTVYQFSVLADVGKGLPQWRFDTTTAAADPGANLVRFNNATFGSITALYLDDLSQAGQDWSTIFATLEAGDFICFHSRDRSSIACLFQLSADATDSSGYFTLSVTPIDGTIPSNNELLVLSTIKGLDVSGSIPGGWGIWTCGSIADAAPSAGGISFDDSDPSAIATIKVSEESNDLNLANRLNDGILGIGTARATDGTSYVNVSILAHADSGTYSTYTVLPLDWGGTLTAAKDYTWVVYTKQNALSGAGAPGTTTGNYRLRGTPYINTSTNEIYFLVDNTTSANVWSTPTGAGGGGGGGMLQYEYVTGGGAPASTTFTANSATLSSVTTLNLADASSSDNNFSSTYGSLAPGDVIVVRDNAGGAAHGTFRIKSRTDNTTYWTFSVTPLDVSGSFVATNTYDVWTVANTQKAAAGKLGDFEITSVTAIGAVNAGQVTFTSGTPSAVTQTRIDSVARSGESVAWMWNRSSAGTIIKFVKNDGTTAYYRSGGLPTTIADDKVLSLTYLGGSATSWAVNDIVSVYVQAGVQFSSIQSFSLSARIAAPGTTFGQEHSYPANGWNDPNWAVASWSPNDPESASGMTFDNGGLLMPKDGVVEYVVIRGAPVGGNFQARWALTRLQTATGSSAVVRTRMTDASFAPPSWTSGTLGQTVFDITTSVAPTTIPNPSFSAGDRIGISCETLSAAGVTAVNGITITVLVAYL